MHSRVSVVCLTTKFSDPAHGTQRLQRRRSRRVRCSAWLGHLYILPHIKTGNLSELSNLSLRGGLRIKLETAMSVVHVAPKKVRPDIEIPNIRSASVKI